MLKRIIICICSFASLLTFGCNRPSDPTTKGDALAGLVDSERNALEILLRNAGLESNQLRSVGRLGIEKNANSVFVKDGHVRGLRISHSSLITMEPIADLPELEVLWLPDNKIDKIAGLDRAKNLTQLVLSRNQIRSINGLAGAGALETLLLDHNQLGDLADFPSLKSLHTVDVSDNLLQSLNGLGGLPKLWTVIATNNPLTDAEAVRAVRTRGGKLKLPESVAAVSHGVNALRPANESSSTFVLQLPKVNGKKIGQENFGASSTGQVFEYTGRMKSITGTQSLGLLENTHSSADPVTLEMTVKSGRLRIYLADLHGFRYVEANPQRPARITGRLMLGLTYHALLQTVDSEVSGLEWRVYRE